MRNRKPRRQHHTGQVFAALVLIIVSIARMPASAADSAAPASSSSLINDGYADLPGGRIYYQDSGGKGEAVVFLHAGSGNCLVFENQIAPLVKAGFRFISYDRAGQGKSTRAAAAAGAAPAPAVGSTVPEVEQLMDYLKIDRFHLVGVAGGGGTGLQYALGRPQRVLSITVSNSIGNVQDAAYTEIGRRIRPSQFSALPMEMQELGPSYRAANAAGVERWLKLNGEGQRSPMPGAGGAGGGPGGPGGPPGGPGGPGGPPGGLPGGPPGGGTAVTFAALEKFTVPTLLLTGDADMYTPPSVLRMFKEHMRKAEISIIPESGHAAHWENPEVFNKRVIAFLRKH